MRITKVYTRTGDSGDTGLVGGCRVPKDDPRIEACGTVDELSSSIGMARAELARAEPAQLSGDPTLTRQLLDRQLDYIQNQLFDVGASLATPMQEGDKSRVSVIQDSAISYLEKLIDAYNDSLPPLRDFVLPAGNDVTAAVHVARCVARRAERRVITLGRAAEIDKGIIVYLNRLSDLLFVVARWTARQASASEVIWRHGLEAPPVRLAD